MTLTLTHDAPKQIVAGDSIEFLVAVPGDLTGWTGSARLTGPAATMDATSCASEGSDFHIRFAGQTATGTGTYKTSQLPPGQYQLTVWATNGDDRYTVLSVPVSVTADLSTGTPAQQHAMKMLPIIEAAIEARITGNPDGGIEGYAVDGTQVTKLPMVELQKLRAKYSAEISALQNPDRPIGQVKFVMTAAGNPVNFLRRYSQ